MADVFVVAMFITYLAAKASTAAAGRGPPLRGLHRAFRRGLLLVRGLLHARWLRGERRAIGGRERHEGREGAVEQFDVKHATRPPTSSYPDRQPRLPGAQRYSSGCLRGSPRRASTARLPRAWLRLQRRGAVRLRVSALMTRRFSIQSDTCGVPIGDPDGLTDGRSPSADCCRRITTRPASRPVSISRGAEDRFHASVDSDAGIPRTSTTMSPSLEPVAVLSPSVGGEQVWNTGGSVHRAHLQRARAEPAGRRAERRRRRTMEAATAPAPVRHQARRDGGRPVLCLHFLSTFHVPLPLQVRQQRQQQIMPWRNQLTPARFSTLSRPVSEARW